MTFNNNNNGVAAAVKQDAEMVNALRAGQDATGPAIISGASPRRFRVPSLSSLSLVTTGVPGAVTTTLAINTGRPGPYGVGSDQYPDQDNGGRSPWENFAAIQAADPAWYDFQIFYKSTDTAQATPLTNYQPKMYDYAKGVYKANRAGDGPSQTVSMRDVRPGGLAGGLRYIERDNG